jgi:hypothetical protein
MGTADEGAGIKDMGAMNIFADEGKIAQDECE